MRKLLRSIAKYRMSRAGIHKPNKWHTGVDQNGLPVQLPSYFSQNWRKYAG